MSSGVFRIYLLLLCLSGNVKNSGNWERFKKIQKLFNLRCANNLTDTEIEGKLTKRFSKIWAHLTYLSPFPEISEKFIFPPQPSRKCCSIRQWNCVGNWNQNFESVRIESAHYSSGLKFESVESVVFSKLVFQCPSPTFVKWGNKKVTEILGLNILYRGVTNLFS